MTENDRPLPNPPRTRFGRRIRGEEEGAGPSTADRLAQAAAEGRLEEVLQHEIPEGEHARNLAMMMLGMSGLLPPGMPGVTEAAAPGASPGPSSGASAPAVDTTAGGQAPSFAPGGAAAAVPPEVLAATMQGDIVGLMSLLQAEHARRRGEGSAEGHAPGGAPGDEPPSVVGAAPLRSAPAGPAAAAPPVIDKALVDEMIRIAAGNQVTVDWLVLRAVRLYLEEHRRTGRL